MELRNTLTRYGALSKFFHWMLTLLVIIQFYLALWTIYVLPEHSPEAALYIGKLHIPIGIVVLGLTLLAILWKFLNPKPAFPPIMSHWEKSAARWVHRLLYLALIIMPLSGLLFVTAGGRPPNFFGLYQFPTFMEENKELSKSLFTVHAITAYTLVALVALHTAAAFKHHFIDRNGVLKRMLPWGG